MADHVRARTLGEIIDALRPEPLRSDQLPALYVPLAAARGIDVAAQLQKYLQRSPRHTCIIVASHRGTGKSTDLVRLRGLLESAYLTVELRAGESLDLDDVGFVDLLVILMERLYAAAQMARVDLPERLLADIHGWLAQEVLTTESAREWGANVEAGGGISYLGALFAKFRGWLKTSSAQRRVLRQRIEPRLTELFDRCNALIARIASATQLGGRRLRAETLGQEPSQRPSTEERLDLSGGHHAETVAISCEACGDRVWRKFATWYARGAPCGNTSTAPSTRRPRAASWRSSSAAGSSTWTTSPASAPSPP